MEINAGELQMGFESSNEMFARFHLAVFAG